MGLWYVMFGDGLWERFFLSGITIYCGVDCCCLGAPGILIIDTAGVVSVDVVTVLPAKWGGPVIGVGGVAGRMFVDTRRLDVSRTTLETGVQGSMSRVEAAVGVAAADRFLAPLPKMCGSVCPLPLLCGVPLF